MKLSIITATYNSVSTIEDCISSVNNQTYPKIEHIIIDGASTDNTLEIIKSIPNRVTQLISEPDNGIYDAMNKGIKTATGDIIGFLHSDDLFASNNVLSSVLEQFSISDVDGVYGDIVYIDKFNIDKIIRYWESNSYNNKSLKYGWMPAHPTLFLKKEVYKKHGLFDLRFRISSDYDFMLRILKVDELTFGYLPVVITKMRVGGASNKSFNNIVQKSKEDFLAIKKNNVGGFYTLVLKNIRKLFQFIIEK